MKKYLNNYINNDIKLNKRQKIGIICSIISISGVFGFLYEFIFYFFNSGMKEFYYRGGNFLPWINIYAYGALLIIFLTYKRRKHPLQVFLIGAIACGILELIGGILMDQFSDVRCWSYNEEILNFGNIGGFVCLRSVLFFGLSSFVLMYVFNPVGIYLSKKLNKKVVIILSIIIIALIFADQIYNLMIAKPLGLRNAIQIYKTYGIKYM